MFIICQEGVVPGTLGIHPGTKLPMNGYTRYVYQNYLWNLPELEAMDIGSGGMGRQYF